MATQTLKIRTVEEDKILRYRLVREARKTGKPWALDDLFQPGGPLDYIRQEGLDRDEHVRVFLQSKQDKETGLVSGNHLVGPLLPPRKRARYAASNKTASRSEHYVLKQKRQDAFYRFCFFKALGDLEKANNEIVAWSHGYRAELGLYSKDVIDGLAWMKDKPWIIQEFVKKFMDSTRDDWGFFQGKFPTVLYRISNSPQRAYLRRLIAKVFTKHKIINLSFEDYRDLNLIPESFKLHMQDGQLTEEGKRQFEGIGHRTAEGFRNFNRFETSTGLPPGFQRTRPESNLSFVYLVVDRKQPGWIKVGVSDNPEQRLAKLRTGHRNRKDLQLVRQFECAEYHKLETHLHKKFPSESEWVKANVDDVVKAAMDFLGEE